MAALINVNKESRNALALYPVNDASEILRIFLLMSDFMKDARWQHLSNMHSIIFNIQI